MLGGWFDFQQQRRLVQKRWNPSLVMSILGRSGRLDVREVGATAETAVASLLPSSGFWPASPNVSRCSKWLKRKSSERKIMKMREKKKKHSQRSVWTLKKLMNSIYSWDPWWGRWRWVLTWPPSVSQSPSSGWFSPPSERWFHSSVWSWHLNSAEKTSECLWLKDVDIPLNILCLMSV